MFLKEYQNLEFTTVGLVWIGSNLLSRFRMIWAGFPIQCQPSHLFSVILLVLVQVSKLSLTLELAPPGNL